MPKVLVSGSAGYIASVLIPELLSQGYTVHGIDNLFYGQQQTNFGTGFTFEQIDVRDTQHVKKNLDKFDVIFWLAALVGPVCDKNQENAKNAIETNFESVEQLVKIASPNQRIILPTTNSFYGQSDVICTEESPIKPLSLYAQTKRDGEKAILKHPKATSMRLATVAGSTGGRMRLDLLVNDFVYKAYFDRKLMIHEGHRKRNYVCIKDVANIFVKLIDRPESYQQIYNLGCDSANCTKKELVLEIAKQLDFNILFPKSAGKHKDVDNRDYIVSSKKLEEQLGLKACLGLSYMISDLIQYYARMPRNSFERRHMIRGFRNA